MFKKITENVEIHQTLSDTPNLTTDELKREWDKGCKIIKASFNSLIDELNNNLYPIGYRMFINSDIDYSNHLGFTWTKVAKGRVLIGKDENQEEFNALKKTGGEKEHILSVNEMPSHSHMQYVASNDGVQAKRRDYNEDGQSSIYEQGCYTGQTGGNQAHNNLPPYEVVNIWERIL